MFRKFTLLIFITTLSTVNAQNPDFKGLEHLFTTPKAYVIARTGTPPVIDGNINDKAWQLAEWTDEFQDIEGDLKPKPYYPTKVKMLWDDNYLYIAAMLYDKHVWGNLTEHDEIVFFDNDFEVFIDPTNTAQQYFEIEINARNNIFDLFLPKTYRAGGSALIAWDSKGLKHAVHIYGSINNPDDEDEGWSVEMAIPFKDITVGNNARIPNDGSIWRINFSRVQWETEVIDGKYVKGKKDGKPLPENNWVWSPQGIIDMHAPQRWGYILFSSAEQGSTLPQFEVPYEEYQRQYLWLVYYKQGQYRRQNKRFAKSLKELGLKESVVINNISNKLKIDASTQQFTAVIMDDKNPPIIINNEGLIWK